MSETTLRILDKLFFAFHTIWIAFNLIGWARRETRPIHRITVALTAFSWFVLGAFYGWGYCLCTDWHFRVRRALGERDPESSYVQLLIHHVLGIELSRRTSDRITIAVFACVVAAAAIGYRRDRRALAERRLESRSSNAD